MCASRNMQKTNLFASQQNGSAADAADYDKNQVLDLLLAQKMAFTQDFLRARNLAFSGNKLRLRERLANYVDSQTLSIPDLISLLNQIEGWGRQHIYLYRCVDRLVEDWSSEAFAVSQLKRAGLIDLLDAQRTLLLPEVPTITSIHWSPSRMKLVWVEARHWEQRLQDEDIAKADLVWRAYKRHISRGIVTFEWNLLNGRAMLMIEQLPRGFRYSESRDFFASEMEPIVSLGRFQPIQVSKAIKPIEQSEPVRCRQIAFESPTGATAQFTSASRSRDVYQDDTFESAADIMRDSTIGSDGNFYWQKGGGLSRELHCRIYGHDQRVGIFGQHREADVRHVLEKIIRHSS